MYKRQPFHGLVSPTFPWRDVGNPGPEDIDVYKRQGLSADAGSSGTLFLLLATVALVVLAAVYARFRRVSAS